MVKLTPVVLVAIFLTACGTEPTRPAAMAGGWHAQVSSSIFGSGPLDLFVTQSGTALSSPTVVIGFGNCAGIARMDGSINGNAVTLNVRWMADFSYLLTFVGTLSNRVISGSYTTSGAPQCGPGDKGTFTAAAVPSVAASSWSGLLTSSFGHGNPNFTANLSEDAAGNVTASLTFTDSFCLHSLTLTGTQVGNMLNLSSDALNVTAEISSDGRSVTGMYKASSTCSFDSGTFSMTRS